MSDSANVHLMSRHIILTSKNKVILLSFPLNFLLVLVIVSRRNCQVGTSVNTIPQILISQKHKAYFVFIASKIIIYSHEY